MDALATDFTVHLTVSLEDADEIESIPTLAASKVKQGTFRVYGTNRNTVCHFDYLVMGSRGPVNVEPKKTDVEVKGFGPYTWI